MWPRRIWRLYPHQGTFQPRRTWTWPPSLHNIQFACNRQQRQFPTNWLTPPVPCTRIIFLEAIHTEALSFIVPCNLRIEVILRVQVGLAHHPLTTFSQHSGTLLNFYPTGTFATRVGLAWPMSTQVCHAMHISARLCMVYTSHAKTHSSISIWGHLCSTRNKNKVLPPCDSQGWQVYGT
jgi:hypothetical protein